LSQKYLLNWHVCWLKVECILNAHIFEKIYWKTTLGDKASTEVKEKSISTYFKIYKNLLVSMAHVLVCMFNLFLEYCIYL
jgi:hypothetical protein